MFSISTIGFISKPSNSYVPYIKFEKKELRLEELESVIKSGHALSAIFSCPSPIKQSDRTLNNFEFTNCIMLDLDNDVNCDLQSLVDSLSIQPSIAYTTFSHQVEGKGNRYRLLYIPEEPIASISEYKTLYNYICKQCGLTLKDNCGNNPVQFFYGSKPDCDFILTKNILKTRDIINSDLYKKISNEITGHQKYNKKEERTLCLYCPVEIKITDEEYINDYDKLNDIILFQKYDSKYPFFENNMVLPDEESEDTPIIEIPKNYLYIKRRSRPEPILSDKNEIKGYQMIPWKWKDGEKRRKKLFLNAILRRFMKEDITFEHLLHCLRKELYEYYHNSVDSISLYELKEIAERAYKSNLEQYIPFKYNCLKSNPKFRVNKKYCIKYGVSAKSVAAKIGFDYREQKREEIYDASLKDTENAIIFKENGVGSSEKTVRRFRKRHGIDNLRNRRKSKE